MNKRVVVALIVCASLLCGGGLIGLTLLVKVMGERRAVVRDRARAELEQMRERAQVREKDPDLFLERVTEHTVDWDEVAVAYENSKPPPVADVAEFAPVFEALGRAIEREDKEAADRLTDLKRFVEELVRVSGWQADNPARTQELLEKEFRDHIARCLVEDKGLRWKHTDIRRIDWLDGGKEASVYAVHRSGTGESFKARWWFIRRDGEWKVFDTTDLYLALRFTRDPATLNVQEVTQLNSQKPGGYNAARAAISVATRAMNNGLNPDEADAALAPTRGLRLAPEDAAIRAIVEGRVLTRRGAFDDALLQFDVAERLVPGMPAAASYRAAVLNEAGRFEGALAAIREYRLRCGPDSHAHAAEAYALEGLGRQREAANAYRAALDDDPDARRSLLGLRRVIPDKEKPELGTRLAKARNPRRMYDEIVGDLHRDRDDIAADILLDALRKARPDDPRGLGDDVRRKVKVAKFDDAKKLMEHGLKAATRDDREQVLDSYLFAMRSTKKTLDAYTAVPTAHVAYAFRTLAEDLDDEYYDRDDGTPAAQLAQLKELVAAHRKSLPDDPWIWFYQGAIHQNEKDYDKAAEAFATGSARLPKVVVNDPDGEDDDAGAARRFRWRRIACMFSAKKGLEAYEKVTPTADVFQQLAGLYDRADDFDGLAALLTAHRKREPNDIHRTYWQAHLSFRKRDYATATLLYKKFMLETDEKVLNRWSAREEYVRGTLRTKPEDASRLLTELGADKVAHALRAAVAAETGDRSELERLLAETTKNGAKVWFYHDEDFRRAIGQEQWRDLRTKYPDPNPPSKLDG